MLKGLKVAYEDKLLKKEEDEDEEEESADNAADIVALM